MDHNDHDRFPLSSKMVAVAKSGNRDSIHKLLAAYCEAIDSGQTPDPPILRYIAEAMRKVLDGEGSEVVFAMRRDRAGRPKRPKPSRPSNTRMHRDWRLAGEVVKRMQKRPRLTDAYRRVAKDNSVTVSMVRRAYQTWGSMVSSNIHAMASVRSGIQLLDMPEETPEAKSANDLVHRLRLAESYLRKLGAAFDSWEAWASGLVTDELQRRARGYALDFCEEFAAMTAMRSSEETSAATWSAIREKQIPKALWDIWTVPPAGHEVCLVSEGELETVWIRGFSTARQIVSGGATLP